MPQETISRLFFNGLNDRKFRGQKAVEGLWRIELHPVPAPGGDVIGIAPLALVPLDRLRCAADGRQLKADLLTDLFIFAALAGYDRQRSLFDF